MQIYGDRVMYRYVLINECSNEYINAQYLPILNR